VLRLPDLKRAAFGGTLKLRYEQTGGRSDGGQRLHSPCGAIYRLKEACVGEDKAPQRLHLLFCHLIVRMMGVSFHSRSLIVKMSNI